MSEKKEIRNKEFIIIAICFINLLMLFAINANLDYFNSVDDPNAGIMVYKYETYGWKPNPLFYSFIMAISSVINISILCFYILNRLIFI